MTVYAYNKVAVYAEFAGTLRLAARTRVFVTDAVTGDPVSVTQGVVVQPYLDTDESGIASFTAEHPGPLRLRSGSVFVDAYSNELPGIALDAVAAAEAAAADAAATAASVLIPVDTAVAGFVETTSATQTALDERYARAVDMLTQGAAADGVTDDWAVFVSARTLAGAGGVVHFPARRGAASTTYYLAGSVPNLSGTHISTDQGVTLRFDSSHAELKDWGATTPFIVQDIAQGTTRRKEPLLPASLAAIQTANLTTEAADVRPVDLTGWTRRAVASGGYAPYTPGTPASVVVANQASWSSAFSDTIEGVSVPVTVGQYYECLAETTGTSGTSWAGPMFLSADGHVVAMRFQTGSSSIDVLGSTSFAAAATITGVPAQYRLPATSGGVILGIKVRSLRTADIYANGRRLHTITFLKDLHDVGFAVNNTESNLKTLSEVVTYGTGYVPPNTRQIIVSAVGDSILYEAWASPGWSDLLRVAMHGLPGGGDVTVRANYAIGGTAAQNWATPGSQWDIAQYDFTPDDYVLVMLGTNDGQGLRGKAAYIADMTTITAKIVADGAIPVIGIFPIWVDAATSGVTGATTANYTRAARLRAALLRWAVTTGYPYALVSPGIGEAWHWYADNIHPEAAGHAAIARAFAQGIARHSTPPRPTSSAGAELGYEEITSPSAGTTSTTMVDVPGLSVTFVAGEGPVDLVFTGWMRNLTGPAWGSLVLDGTPRRLFGRPSSDYNTQDASVRVSGLTPGTVHTFKLQVSAPAGGTTYVMADNVNPAPTAVRVVSA